MLATFMWHQRMLGASLLDEHCQWTWPHGGRAERDTGNTSRFLRRVQKVAPRRPPAERVQRRGEAAQPAEQGEPEQGEPEQGGAAELTRDGISDWVVL
jgi:hypothetical protein